MWLRFNGYIVPEIITERTQKIFYIFMNVYMCNYNNQIKRGKEAMDFRKCWGNVVGEVKKRKSDQTMI